jgi:hypothetical protein
MDVKNAATLTTPSQFTWDVPVPGVAGSTAEVGVICGGGAAIASDEGQARGKAHDICIGSLCIPDCNVGWEDSVVAGIQYWRNPV